MANAPHIPVHLGSMGEVVADLLSQVQARASTLQSGEILLRRPFHGGTHLPDITAITPVFAAEPVAFGLPWSPRGCGWHTPDRCPQPNHCR